jgi:hypothetical protein
VLHPVCGPGNFPNVALDTLKRLQAIEELRARCLETRQLVEV